jgi:hypothetical protein
VASRTDTAERLLAAVETQRHLARADRPTKASDQDLELAAALLAGAARADESEDRIALRGRQRCRRRHVGIRLAAFGGPRHLRRPVARPVDRHNSWQIRVLVRGRLVVLKQRFDAGEEVREWFSLERVGVGHGVHEPDLAIGCHDEVIAASVAGNG